MIDPIDQVTLPLPVSTANPIKMRFMAADRLYTVILMQDLFGQWVIMQGWGGKHNRGGSRTRPYDSLDAGLEALAVIARQHEKRGNAQLAA